jgi:3-methyl-2-oxobutanoate hydroxymethyltransferase
MERMKVTIPYLLEKKEEGKKITMLTAYDYPLATLVDRVGIDMILVGDSVGNVVLGYDSPVPVTMEEMIHHAKAVRRATKYALLVGDMPFMSFNVSTEDAIRNAGRFIKEAGCEAVKLETGEEPVIKVTKSIVDAGIPVLGHLGLTPQTATKLGGLKVQGKDANTAKRLCDLALALEKAGCFGIILECVPDQLAALITQKVNIPTIGIGAGAGCDGQVLVIHDLLGLFERFVPKFVKQYAHLSEEVVKAVSMFKEEVESGEFPSKEHSFSIKKEEISKLKI